MPAIEEPSRSGTGADPSEFLIKHRADWLSYALAHSRNYQDAEDAVSYAAEKILRQYAETGTFCPDGYDPTTWAKRVIANYINDLNRIKALERRAKHLDPDSESREFRHYVEAFDKVDRGFAERILSLIAEEHRYEYRRAKWVFVSKALRVTSAFALFALVAGIIIYLFAHGEHGAAQTILGASNGIVLFASVWSLWFARAKFKESQKTTLNSQRPRQRANGDKSRQGVAPND